MAGNMFDAIHEFSRRSTCLLFSESEYVRRCTYVTYAGNINLCAFAFVQLNVLVFIHFR